MVATFHEPVKSPIKQAEHPPYTWHSPQRRATWTLNLIALHILVMVASIASNWLEIDILQRIQDGKTVTEAAITSNDTRQAIIWCLYYISYIGLIVAFLMWISRASKNLSALGASNQKFSPGWAVGWWFIPIAWLWQPYRVTAEIWVESHPERHRVSRAAAKRTTGAEQNCTTGVMPDGHGLAGGAGGLAWSGAGAGLGRTLIGGRTVRRWR